MTPPLGPKGPIDGSLQQGRVLQLRPAEKIAESPKVDGPFKTQQPTSGEQAFRTRYEGAIGTSQSLAPPLDGAGASQVLARLKALAFEGSKVTKTPESARIVDTTEGKVLSGSVSIESPRDLAKLEGVVRVGGDLTIHEGILQNADLLVLQSLKSVERRLTFEGLSSG